MPYLVQAPRTTSACYVVTYNRDALYFYRLLTGSLTGCIMSIGKGFYGLKTHTGRAYALCWIQTYRSYFRAAAGVVARRDRGLRDRLQLRVTVGGHH